MIIMKMMTITIIIIPDEYFHRNASYFLCIFVWVLVIASFSFTAVAVVDNNNEVVVDAFNNEDDNNDDDDES